MNPTLAWLVANREGLGVLAQLLVGLVALLLLLAWTFGWGRFAGHTGTTGESNRPKLIRYLVTEALTKIINDFRHLLALIIVLIFACALSYALWESGGHMDDIKEALQAVSATLGGLVGSIIGYYFGESKAIRQIDDGAAVTGAPIAEQRVSGGTDQAQNGIAPARRPDQLPSE